MSLTICTKPAVAELKVIDNSNRNKPNELKQNTTLNTAVETNFSTPQANLAKLKRDGQYRPEEKFLFGLITREAQYTYYANGYECIADIKAKFGLKDGAISKCNQNIQDDEWIPPKGYEIFFYEKDANCNDK